MVVQGQRDGNMCCCEVTLPAYEVELIRLAGERRRGRGCRAASSDKSTHAEHRQRRNQYAADACLPDPRCRLLLGCLLAPVLTEELEDASVAPGEDLRRATFRELRCKGSRFSCAHASRSHLRPSPSVSISLRRTLVTVICRLRMKHRSIENGAEVVAEEIVGDLDE